MFILCLRPCKKQIKRLNMKHLYTIQHIFLGELAQVIAGSMESISAKPIMNGSAQKMIDKFSIPQVKYRQSLTTDRFRNPILPPRTDPAGDRPIIDAIASIILPSTPDHGSRTTKAIRQHGSRSQSKKSADAMTYLYIGISAVGLLLATGGVIFLTKWILKKKIQGRVIDVDSS